MLVQEAQNSKAPAQLLADRWVGQPLLFAMTLTITVFVIACPDALGLATRRRASRAWTRSTCSHEATRA
jgi:cation transport ATPase